LRRKMLEILTVLLRTIDGRAILSCRFHGFQRQLSGSEDGKRVLRRWGVFITLRGVIFLVLNAPRTAARRGFGRLGTMTCSIGPCVSEYLTSFPTLHYEVIPS
jgi:hypothetical protein